MFTTNHILKFAGLIVAALSGVSSMADEAETRWTPELMIQIKRIGAVQVSPDGDRVAFAVKSPVMDDDHSEYRTHIHLADDSGKNSRQLTQGDHSCDDPQWSPDGRWIAFLSDRSGKKNLWRISPDGGEALPVTDLVQNVDHFRWSPEGSQIAFTALDADTEEELANRRAKNDAQVVGAKPKQNRLYVTSVTDAGQELASPRLLTPADRHIGGELFRSVHAPFDWSPDGTAIAFCHVASPRINDWPTADLAIVETKGGAIRALAKTKAAESSPRFSPNGSQIAYTASDDPPTWAGRKHLRVIPATGGDSTPLAETHDGFGRYSELLGWTAAGDGVYFTEAYGTSLRLMRMPLDREPVAVSSEVGMAISGMFLNSKRTHVGFGWETTDSAAEAFATRVEDWQPTQISHVQPDSLPQTAKTEIIRWKSPDGREIEGLLTHPAQAKRGVKSPLLVVIHGGPMGVFTQLFDGSPAVYPIAAFADAGFAVLRPNVRGSSGYGAEFRYANYGDWGGGDYQDLIAGVDHLIEQGVADENRMGVMGWSYGGYMTAWTITQTSRFRAASVGAGVTNLMSFTGTTDIPDFLPDYLRGEFFDDVEMFRTRSPLHQVRGVTTPTLIQHGDKDERVPIGQSWEFYHALKRQGCETEFVIYPRTPHGFEEPRLLLDCMERNLGWFRQTLPAASRAFNR